jgi:hypothetical protein
VLGLKAGQYGRAHLKRDGEKFRLRGGVAAGLAERLARETASIGSTLGA